MLFKHSAVDITFVERLDIPKSNGGASQGAMKMFQNMDKRGQSDEVSFIYRGRKAKTVLCMTIFNQLLIVIRD